LEKDEPTKSGLILVLARRGELISVRGEGSGFEDFCARMGQAFRKLFDAFFGTSEMRVWLYVFFLRFLFRCLADFHELLSCIFLLILFS